MFGLEKCKKIFWNNFIILQNHILKEKKNKISKSGKDNENKQMICISSVKFPYYSW